MFKFGQFVFRKIHVVKIVSTRCYILRLICTKFDFGWGSARIPLGELTESSDFLVKFKGSYF